MAELRPRSARTVRSWAALAAAGGLALLLAGCSPETDPESARESLTEVTEDPAPPAVDDELDAETNPDPIVEPLECSPYLVITSRGMGEPEKGQLLSPVARAVTDARPDETTVANLDYPADTEVKDGGTRGVRMLVDTLNVQAEECEDQRFILLGYSQGALVTGDALVAPEARLIGPTVGQVSEEAAERVLAIVLYGDPRFVGAEPFNAGSFDAEVDGMLPRPPGSLEAFADRIRDYCVDDDFICQGSLNLEEEGHVAYYENGMQQDGAAYVITRLAPLGQAAEAAE